jgi:hypothetical protein
MQIFFLCPGAKQFNEALLEIDWVSIDNFVRRRSVFLNLLDYAFMYIYIKNGVQFYLY